MINRKTNLSFLLFFLPYISMGQSIPDWNWNKIVSNEKNPLENPGVDLTNRKFYNKSLFFNCTFDSGLLNIKGIDSVYFYNCTFENFGVKLGNRTTNNITFENCKFLNVTANGIVTVISDRNDHFNLMINNCYFEGWGKHTGISVCETENECDPKYEVCERCNDAYNKFDHAIYCRATDALIENCKFYHTTGGAAISIRNSATVRNNRIFTNQTGVGSALAYWPQYKSRGSKIITIVNNAIIEYAQDKEKLTKDNKCDCGNSFKSLVNLSANNQENLVDSIIFRFNTIVLMDSLESEDFYLLRYSNLLTPILNMEGNIFVDPRSEVNFLSPDTELWSLNFYGTDLAVFNEINESANNYDLRLTNITDSLIYQKAAGESPVIYGAYQLQYER